MLQVKPKKKKGKKRKTLRYPSVTLSVPILTLSQPCVIYFKGQNAYSGTPSVILLSVALEGHRTNLLLFLFQKLKRLLSQNEES